MSSFGLAVEIIVALLLVAAIIWAFVLDRRLRDLKQGRDGMRQTVVDMAAAANRAEAAVAALRQSAQTAAVELAARQAQAKAAADELSMLVSAADGLAERLVTNAQARRQPARPVDLVGELRGAR